MKFFHLSDLHIGKQLHHYNLKEDQRYILQEIIRYAKELHPDAIVIAGDIYDKSVPSAEAVTIFDEFLTGISEITPKIPVLAISGNHDSSERLEYASEILKRQGIYLSGDVPKTPEEYLKKVTLQDAYGPVNFYLLPFMKPSYVRNVFEGVESLSYSEAVGKIIDREKIDFKDERNVLISHQFYVGMSIPETCDSETISVGGLDQVSAEVLRGFEYVALGHIHGAQDVRIRDAGEVRVEETVARENAVEETIVGKNATEETETKETIAGEKRIPRIRYCGTPLKYSVSEAGQEKSLTIVEIFGKKEKVQVMTVPLHPLRDVKKKRGSLQEILQIATEEERDDYISVTFTDEVEPYKPKEQLQQVYDHILEVNVDNTRTRTQLADFDECMTVKDPMTNFEEFYLEIQGRELTEKEREIMKRVISEIGEEL